MKPVLASKCTLLILTCVISLLAAAATAQTAPAASPSPTPNPQDTRIAVPDKTDQASTTMDDSEPVPDLILAATSARTLDQPGVKELNGNGRLFSDNFDWFHWGPVGVQSLEAFYNYAMQDVGDTTFHLSVTTLQANIAYNQRFARTRIIWQYNPRLLIGNGQVEKQLLNQDSTLDVMFQPGAHVTFGVSNLFSYYGQDNTFNDRTLDRNTFSGAITNPFLNNGARTLLESVALPLSYNSSARTTYTVAPFYSYAWTQQIGDSTVPQTSDNISSSQYGARAQVSHAISSSQSFGVFYTYQIIQEQKSANSNFQSVGLTWSKRLGRSFAIVAEGGGSRSTSDNTKTWTGVGQVTATKSFRRSSVDATYGRNVNFASPIGNGYSDYAWANYNTQLSRRLSARAGFGYLTGLGTTVHGKYVNGSINYSVFRNVSWFFGYMRYTQDVHGVQVFGNQSQFQTGLSWSPRRREPL